MANHSGRPTFRSRFCTAFNHEVDDPNEYMVHFAKRRKDELIIESQVCGWCYKLHYENCEKPKFRSRLPKLSNVRITQLYTKSPATGAREGAGEAEAVCGSVVLQMVVQGPSTAPPVALELTAGKTLIEMELKNGFSAAVKSDRERWRN
ncbi:uncharacterized protein LOC6547689 [Drosophila erecta]|uniref:uncharacterized protein LOC6547689 n=1 Tax=Drosophila erecta TaxID=7220 RepID=UPI000F052F33|nr:uncharacterized protein LOC6547689 [Drosophila erecta]